MTSTACHERAGLSATAAERPVDAHHRGLLAAHGLDQVHLGVERVAPRQQHFYVVGTCGLARAPIGHDVVQTEQQREAVRANTSRGRRGRAGLFRPASRAHAPTQKRPRTLDCLLGSIGTCYSLASGLASTRSLSRPAAKGHANDLGEPSVAGAGCARGARVANLALESSASRRRCPALQSHRRPRR